MSFVSERYLNRHREPREARRGDLKALRLLCSFGARNDGKLVLLVALSLGLSLALFSFSPDVSSAVRVKVTHPQVKKEDVLKKYEQVIVRSNQMNVYGFDLHDVTFKLKRVTEVLVANQFKQADEMLDEIKNDLKTIEAKGPEHLRRERELAWVEIFGDFIQQVAILFVIVLFLLRFKFVKSAIATPSPLSSSPEGGEGRVRGINFSTVWKLTLVFTIGSIFGALVGLIRYGQSSWSFIDLQIILIGLSGLVGGVWVGVLTGAANGLFRLLMVPSVAIYSAVPLAVGLAAGCFPLWRRGRSLGQIDVLLGGFVIGLIHACFMYFPIFRYLPFKSFLSAISFLAILECVIVFLFFLLTWQIFKEEKRKETERELVRTRLQFLQAQINPHFLFNTLNTIAAVCGEERAERARQLIVQLSTFFRRITRQESDLVSLQDELEYIDAYLDIERARFGDRLQVEKKIQLSASGLQTLVPILALQPIVENAVKHGLSKKSGGGKLILSAEEKDSKIIVEVKDAGVGMSEETKQRLFEKPAGSGVSSGEHAGIGLRNIEERLKKIYGGQFQMTISSALNEGTVVTLILPRMPG